MKCYTGFFNGDSPENNYRPMRIGCFAPTGMDKSIFVRSFADANMEIIKTISIRGSKIRLLDDTELLFFSLTFPEDSRGYYFNQFMFYNMTEDILPLEILCQLDDGYIPSEILKDAKYLYYKD